MASISETKPATPESEALRTKIASGMRWTLWLSILTAPLGYATTILLARSGPAVIGAYGIVLIYGALSSCLFYFGGDAVIIKFVPGMQVRKRLGFLATYYVITCLALIPWLLAAVIWPEKLHYIFGRITSSHTQVILVCLAPIYILFSITQAGLKSVLQIREAQMLLRIITVGSFAIYATLFLFGRSFLLGHYAYLVWGIYLSLTGIAAMSGIVLLIKANPQPEYRFHLPQGFWRYTLATEQVSALSFLAGTLISFLVLNYGGLETLGKYVLVLSLADILRVANRYVSDSLMPSLTNLIASGDHTGVAELFSINFRTLLLVNCAACTAMMAFIEPISAVVGPHYNSIAGLFVIVAFLCGTAMTGSLGGTLLSSFAKQEFQIITNLLQLGGCVALFFVLWPLWHLKGAVVAWGTGMLFGSICLITVARWVTRVKFAFVKDYLVLLAITAIVAVVSLHYLPLGIGAGFGLWVVAVGSFLLVAGYRVKEIKTILHYFVPGRISAWCRRLLSRLRDEGDPPAYLSER